MAKYVYPAIFTAEESGGYSVRFPDIEGCYTQGDTLAEALEMAKDALCLMLYDYEETERVIPEPSYSKGIEVSGDDIISLVCCDTLDYRQFYDGKAVKKTLTVPNWLNTAAERKNINFSAVLQEALKDRLNIH